MEKPGYILSKRSTLNFNIEETYKNKTVMKTIFFFRERHTKITE